MKKAFLVGGGFALYGYLPALIHCGVETVYLKEKNRQKILQRPELLRFQEKVKPFEDEPGCYRNIDSIVIALPPPSQEKFINDELSKFYKPNVFLEKPISATPTQSKRVIELAMQRSNGVKVGYLFIYTRWYETLTKQIAAKVLTDTRIEIDWQFTAHHWKTEETTWKSSDEQGGGALRFYAIHLIAVAAKLGYEKVKNCAKTACDDGKTESVIAEFYGAGLPNLIVHVDTRSPQNTFTVQSDDTVLFSASDPFYETDLPALEGQDKRCGFLIQHICAPFSPFDLQWFEQTNQLWLLVEQCLLEGSRQDD